MVAKTKQREALLLRKQLLLRQVQARLELLQGSIHKNPGQRGYRLTTKITQKTVTKYVRADLVPMVKVMTENHLQLRKLLKRLSDVNWRLLQLPSDP